MIHVEMGMTEKKHAAFKRSQRKSSSKYNFSVLVTRGRQEKYEVARWVKYGRDSSPGLKL
jgi:hypothetical protein